MFNKFIYSRNDVFMIVIINDLDNAIAYYLNNTCIRFLVLNLDCSLFKN